VALNTINPPNHYKCLINSTIKDNCLFFSQAAEKEEEQKSKHTKSGKKLHKTFEKGANLGRETRVVVSFIGGGRNISKIN
jgi:hypothetical protein